MSFNGSGTFQINTAGQPVVTGTVISSTAFNALTADLATGLSTCITKDGQTTPTANIPMGSNKITGLANGTAVTDAATLGQVQSTTAKLLSSVSGTNTITAAASPALSAYAAGQMFYFVAAGANTGAVTLNIDSLGAKSVTRDGSTALVSGDIASGEVVVVIYDGTRFQALAPNTFNGTLPVANGGTGATTLTGVIKGNGTSAFTAATAGTDYVAPGTATTFTATQSFSGTSSTLGMVLTDAAETTTVSATAATGTINYDVTTQSVLFYTSNASANWTVNLRGSSGTSMNTLLSTGQSITMVFLVTQGSTAYYNTSVQVDGTTSGVTTRWQGGAAPTSGNASSVDAYTYTVIKTGSATFSVFAALTRFA